MFRQKSEDSIDPKPEDYILSLHGINESSKDVYSTQIRTFGRFLLKCGIERFEDVTMKDIDVFFSRYQKDNTKNCYIGRLKHFYGKFLRLPNLTEHLKIANNDIQPVTPSELLTPEEVVKLANESGRKSKSD